MATTTLVIDGDRDHFFLALDGGTLRVGDDPARPGGVARGLRVVRIRCEVEVEGTGVQIDGVDETSPAREVGHNGPVEVGRVRLSLVPGVADATTPPPGLSRRLVVIDGADHGHVFKLPAAGTVTIGKNGKGTDIGLGDLYVARTHCRLEIEDGRVTVTHLDGSHGTLIDGRRIDRPETLRPGSTLRVGNSHLRLEVGAFADEPPPPAEGPAVLRPTAAPRPIAPPPRPADPFAQLEGQVLGHYRVGPVLGRGFTGAVFRATDEKSGQPVALKVFAAEFPASAAELERFSRVIRDGQQVRHPNLVAPLGAGKTGPHCWIAREYVEGESAADVIERIADGEKSSWARAARVGVHLARVLDALHQHRLVHGNITPRNVLIRRPDGATKLTDLQLGKALDGSRLQAAVLEKKLLAEMPYLAPEQTDPGAFVDDSADLYCAGAVVYALATGRPPVAGNTPEDVLDAVREGRVVKPSVVSRKIPAAFETVLLKVLARAQEDRYASPAALLEDLEPLAQFPETGK